MTKVLTFSRTFPAFHPKAGQPTYFVEKILNSISADTTYFIAECEWCGWRGMSSLLKGGSAIADTGDFDDGVCPKCGSNKVDDSEECSLGITYYNQSDLVYPKHHTIRAGNNWKVGDMFSPRAWSGKPYNSPQITIAPDIRVEKVWDAEVDEDLCLWIIGGDENDGDILDKVALNDGLELQDLLSWFNKPMVGQIICWNKKIEY